jgi:heme a synthase
MTSSNQATPNNINLPLSRFAWSVLAYNIVVILWGAFVRMSGSGAGCGSHWPTCNGEIIPLNFTLERFIEFSHRATTGLAGIFVLGLLVWAFQALPKGHAARVGAIWSFGFILLEGALGAGIVLLGWTGVDKSLGRVITLPMHFASTLLLLGTLAYTAVSSAGIQFKRLENKNLRLWCYGTALLTLVLGATGAVTALGDTVFPSAASETLAEGIRKTLDSGSSFLVQLRIIHPALALLTSGALIGLVLGLKKTQPHNVQTSRASWILMLTLAAQVVAGVLNIVLKAPYVMQITHLFLACVLWLALLNVYRTAMMGQVQARAETRNPNSITELSL